MSKAFNEFLEEWAYGSKDPEYYEVEFSNRELASVLLATKMMYKQLGGTDDFEIERNQLRSIIEKCEKVQNPDYNFDEDSNMKLKIFSHEKKEK